MTIPPDLQVYLTLFVRDLEEHRSPKTATIYEGAVKQFERFLDELDSEPTIAEGVLIEPGALASIADAGRDHVKAFLRWMRKQKSQRDGGPWSGSYRSNIFRGVQAFFKWMVVNDYCPNNPTANIDGPQADEDDVEILEHAELRLILGTCGKGRWDRRPFREVRDEAALRVFMDVGLRCSEQLMSLDDLHLNHQTMTVTGKGRNGRVRRRTVSYGDRTAAALRFYLLARQGYVGDRQFDQLWVGRWGAMTDSGLRQMVVERSLAVGLKVHPHMFRHTCALHMKLRGEPDHVLMAHFGWESPAMIKRYARIADERVATEAMKRASLGDLL